MRRAHYRHIEEHPDFDTDWYGPQVPPGCSDRMCGAEDCSTCFPNARYAEEEEEEEE